jgi:hypothetical protein
LGALRALRGREQDPRKSRLLCLGPTRSRDTHTEQLGQLGEEAGRGWSIDDKQHSSRGLNKMLYFVCPSMLLSARRGWRFWWARYLRMAHLEKVLYGNTQVYSCKYRYCTVSLTMQAALFLSSEATAFGARWRPLTRRTVRTLLYNGPMSSSFDLEADLDPTACDRRARSVSRRGGPEGLSADPLLKSGEPWGNKRSSQPIRESLQQVSVSH